MLLGENCLAKRHRLSFFRKETLPNGGKISFALVTNNINTDKISGLINNQLKECPRGMAHFVRRMVTSIPPTSPRVTFAVGKESQVLGARAGHSSVPIPKTLPLAVVRTGLFWGKKIAVAQKMGERVLRGGPRHSAESALRSCPPNSLSVVAS